MPDHYIVGLTGGIGSGKSTVGRMFADLGVAVVDADEVAHDISAAGQPGSAAVAREFGPEYLAGDGSLDRPRLRQLVFADPAARARLEGVLHPLIRQETDRRLAAATGPYVLLMVPLLLESERGRERVRRVLVVDCDEALQVERVGRRSGLAEAEVRAIMATQLPRVERLRRADDVIANDGNLARLRTQVAELDQRYRALARG